MRTSLFFVIAMAVILVICGYFLLTDGPGSGMGWPTGIVAALLAFALWFDTKRKGK